MIINLNEALQMSVNSFKNYYSNHAEFQKLLNQENKNSMQRPEGSLSENLVKNADFEEGSAGFESEYSVLEKKMSNIFPNKFGWIWITEDPKVKTISWNGHGFGNTGNFLFVDGASVTGRKFWKQKIKVSQGKKYNLSFQIASVLTQKTKIWQRALVNVFINGKETGHILAPDVSGEWQCASFAWSSEKDTLAEIYLLDVNCVSNFNDFGIDHIEFRELANEKEVLKQTAVKTKKNNLLSVNYMEVLNDLFEEELLLKNIQIENVLEQNVAKEAGQNPGGGKSVQTMNIGAHYFDYYFVKDDRFFTNYFFIDNNNFVQCEIKNLYSFLFTQIRNELVLFFIMLVSSLVLLLFIRRYLLKQKEIADLKYQLVNNINHELKTPIATISVAIEALQTFNQINDKEKTTQYLDIAKKQLAKLDQIIDNSFQLSKVEEEDFKLQMEKLDLVQITKEVTEEKKEAFGAPVTINMTAAEDSLMIRADLMHLKNIISTVIDNSVKYSAGMPEVTVTVYRKGA
ncbi:MAG: HAMP domain-containing histidine kinase, partial [Bacteroidia bacterium]|nr:HAMP domain-containing histidine kinase [Bacteroidia bacterium]